MASTPGASARRCRWRAAGIPPLSGKARFCVFSARRIEKTPKTGMPQASYRVRVMKMHVDDHAQSGAAGAEECPAAAAVALAEELLRDSIERTTSGRGGPDGAGRPADREPAGQGAEHADDGPDVPEQARRRAPRRGGASILSQVGIGEGFGLWDRLQLHAGAFGSRVMPDFVMAMVRKRLRDESRDVILSAEEPDLTEFLRKRGERGGAGEPQPARRGGARRGGGRAAGWTRCSRCSSGRT